MTPRFRIRRLPNITTPTGHWALWPWMLTDREHPEQTERFATQKEAIAHIDQHTLGEATA